MPQPSTRHSLIVRLQCRDNEADWQDFVRAYEPFLTRLIVRQGVPSRHVPDATQQVLLAIARSIGQWKSDGQQASFRRWLNVVSRNVVIRFMQRERQQPIAGGGTDLLKQLEQIPDQPDPDEIRQYEHELIVWAAEQIRREFHESSWQAFQRTLVHGETVSAVAESLGITPGAIYMSRSRILSRIREKIQGWRDAPGELNR